MFREQDHTRNPAGKSTGGQFTSTGQQSSTEWQQKGFQSRDEWMKSRMQESLKQMGVPSQQSGTKEPDVQNVDISEFDVGRLPVPKSMRIDKPATNEWYGDYINPMKAQGASAATITDAILKSDDAVSIVVYEKDLNTLRDKVDSHFDTLSGKHAGDDGYLTIDGEDWEDYASQYVDKIASVMARAPMEEYIESLAAQTQDDESADHYSQQKSLFGDESAIPRPKGFREELHAREKDNIPNPNRHPGQFAPKGGSNPLLKVVEHEYGWTASSVLKDGKEFRVEGRDRREAIGNAIRAGEKMGVIFDPPKAEPVIGGLFGGSFDENAHPRHNAGNSDGGQFAPKNQRIYQQFEHETERYLRNYTLVDVDRYGVGGNIMKMILSMVAMHAMSSMMGSGTSSPRKPAAQKQAPSNQDFEKLHPRAQTQAGNSKPGQFAKKPEGAAPAPTQRQARPLTERPDLSPKPSPYPQQQQQQPAPPVQQPPEAAEAAEAPPVEAKPWLAEPGTPTPENTEYNNDPRRGTPEQKAARDQQRMARDQAAAQPPVQQPKDANTARIAEIWDVDTTQPEAPRNYPDNLNKPPDQQQDYAPPEHSLEGFTAQVMKNIKTPANEQDNPRKRFLLDGTPNPGYSPQDISGPERPVEIRKRAVKPTAEPAAEPEPSAPSLLDMPVQSGDGDIFANPAAKARKEKAELDRVTHFDPNDFAENGDEEESFAEGEAFSVPAPTEEQFDTPEQLQLMIEYRARRPDSEDPKVLAAYKKTKPETFESATQKWKAKKYRHHSKTEKNIQGDPREAIAKVAEENEFDPDLFEEYIGGMEAHDNHQWKRRENVKKAILKTWHTTSSQLRDLENREGGDAASLRGADSLKGNLDDDQVYEFLGSDESNWVQNAWDMVREEEPPRPGAHDKDWLRKHAEHFVGMSSQLQPQEDYPEPEDGMPFSRRALVKSVDRYFRDARQSFRARRSQKDSGFWTLLDAYL